MALSGSPEVSESFQIEKISGESDVTACACTRERSTSIESCIQAVAAAEGLAGSLEYRVHFRLADGRAASPWHSVPLRAAAPGCLNFVCEIPRGTRAKFEVATSEAGNPIKQDSKKGKPRFYGIDMLWNYGMLPQTWEDPQHKNPDCGFFGGDNDPVDIVEIGSRTATTGEIYAVKPIAALAMIDEGELDWKIVAIAASDPLASLVNDVTDMEVHFPGVLSSIREWFRTYKTYEGKPENKFGLDEKAMGRAYTLGVIAQTHSFWKNLVQTSRLSNSETVPAIGDVPIPSPCLAVGGEPWIATFDEIAIGGGEGGERGGESDDGDAKNGTKNESKTLKVKAQEKEKEKEKEKEEEGLLAAVQTLVKQFSEEGSGAASRRRSCDCDWSNGSEAFESAPLLVSP